MTDLSNGQLLSEVEGLACDVYYRVMPGVKAEDVPEIKCIAEDGTLYLVIDGSKHKVPMGDVGSPPGAFDRLANVLYDVIRAATLPGRPEQRVSERRAGTRREVDASAPRTVE